MPPSSRQGASSKPVEFSIFVGDLDPRASTADLVAVFRNPQGGQRSFRGFRGIEPFRSCRSAKVLVDPVTKVSKGYGFVRFGDPMEQQRALVQMQGIFCLGRPMRIAPATPCGHAFGSHTQVDPALRNASEPHVDAAIILANQGEAAIPAADAYNTTVFVGGLTFPIDHSEFISKFEVFGPAYYYNILPEKRCGFVQYVHKRDAADAIAAMDGQWIGQNKIRVGWRKSPYNSVSESDFYHLQASRVYDDRVTSAVSLGSRKLASAEHKPDYEAMLNNFPAQRDLKYVSSSADTPFSPSTRLNPSSSFGLLEHGKKDLSHTIAMLPRSMSDPGLLARYGASSSARSYASSSALLPHSRTVPGALPTPRALREMPSSQFIFDPFSPEMELKATPADPYSLPHPNSTGEFVPGFGKLSISTRRANGSTGSALSSDIFTPPYLDTPQTRPISLGTEVPSRSLTSTLGGPSETVAWLEQQALLAEQASQATVFDTLHEKKQDILSKASIGTQLSF